MSQIPIYTIGYGARDIDTFIDVLLEHEIAYLLDVRSKPYSGYKPEYSMKPLAQRLEDEGIRYVYVGDTLGGQPDDRSYYTDGKVDYAKMADSSGYKEGIDRLREAFRQQRRVAIMCSEGKPEQCHRSKLIGQTLTKLNILVSHIDEHDQLITQQDVTLRLAKGQPSLFGDDFSQYTSRKRYRQETDDD